MLSVGKATVGKVDEKGLKNIIEGVHALNDYSFFLIFIVPNAFIT